MQRLTTTTDLGPAQYLTEGEALDLARQVGRGGFSLGNIGGQPAIRILARGYARDFRASAGPLFKAEPIRRWLEA